MSCPSQGENQAGVLHVQPHVCRHREGEPGETGRGLLCVGRLVVHPAYQVSQQITSAKSHSFHFFCFLRPISIWFKMQVADFLFFVNLVFLPLSLSPSRPRPGCSMPEIWDVEDPLNAGKTPLCTHMSRSSRPHFTTVFSNDIYKVLKVPKAANELR